MGYSSIDKQVQIATTAILNCPLHIGVLHKYKLLISWSAGLVTAFIIMDPSLSDPLTVSCQSFIIMNSLSEWSAMTFITSYIGLLQSSICLMRVALAAADCVLLLMQPSQVVFSCYKHIIWLHYSWIANIYRLTNWSSLWILKLRAFCSCNSLP